MRSLLAAYPPVVERGAIDNGWLFLSVADFPISLFLFGLPFRDGRSLLWFSIFGTLWWYLVSWAAWAIVQLLQERRMALRAKAGQGRAAKPDPAAKG